MAFISIAAHQKFVSQCKNLNAGFIDTFLYPETQQQIEDFAADLEVLENLTTSSLTQLEQLSILVDDYKNKQRLIRIKLRKMQLLQMKYSAKYC